MGTYGVETDDIDLYYMRARYYTPSTGRFLTEDPIWSTNLYPYADNNPIRNIDPTGLHAESELDILFIAMSYDAWDKDPSLLNSAALDFDGAFLLLPFAAGGGTAIKGIVKGVDYAQGTRASSRAVSRTLAPPINITKGRLNHVIDGHTITGINNSGKSIFSDSSEILGLIQDATQSPISLQSEGNHVRIIDAGRNIGIDRVTGMPTSIYTIVTNPVNYELITAFPGLPPN